MTNANQRIEKWDNLKFLLIFCVVFGHLCDYYTSQSKLMRSIFFLIYTFHMPLFLFVSGMFSKKNINYNRYSNIFSYLILFYFIKMLMSTTNAFINHHYTFSMFTEGGVPWYAFALFAFSLLTIALKNFSFRYILILSIALACFAGYDDSIGDFLVMSRIIVYYPFFLLGYHSDFHKIREYLSPKHIKILSAIGLVGITIFIFINIDSIYWLRSLLTARNPFSALGDYYAYGAILRFLYYPAVIIIGIMIIALTPEKICGGKLAAIGSRSLQIYALHYPCIYILYRVLNIEKLLKGIFPSHPHILLILLAFLITWFCSLKVWKCPFEMLLSSSKKH